MSVSIQPKNGTVKGSLAEPHLLPALTAQPSHCDQHNEWTFSGGFSQVTLLYSIQPSPHTQTLFSAFCCSHLRSSCTEVMDPRQRYVQTKHFGFSSSPRCGCTTACTAGGCVPFQSPASCITQPPLLTCNYLFGSTLKSCLLVLYFVHFSKRADAQGAVALGPVNLFSVLVIHWL